MPKIRSTLLGFMLPALVLGAEVSSAPAEKPKAKKDCINTRQINVMSPLDDGHVFVKLSADRNYLLTIEDRCQGLGSARRLAIVEASGRACDGGVSLLTFEDPAAGAMRCRIAKIESVKDKAAALELIGQEVPPK